MKIPISSIEIDPDSYPREGVDDLRVAEYWDRMSAGDKFPDIVVYEDGQHRYLSDGRHRILAAQIDGAKEIDADVKHGTRADALWFALGANRAHGSRMTPGDLQHAIRLALREFPDRSPKMIADRIGCSRSYVDRIRAELDEAQASVQVATSSNLPGTEPTATNTDMGEPDGVPDVAAGDDPLEQRMDQSKAEVGGQPGSIQVATSGNLPVTVIGKDGKHYPARRTRGTRRSSAKRKRPTDAETLAQLKRLWKIATPAARNAFTNWIAERSDSDHNLAVTGPPEDSACGAGLDHDAGEDPEARDDGPQRDRDGQDGAEG